MTAKDGSWAATEVLPSLPGRPQAGQTITGTWDRRALRLEWLYTQRRARLAVQLLAWEDAVRGKADPWTDPAGRALWAQIERTRSKVDRARSNADGYKLAIVGKAVLEVWDTEGTRPS
jgi:hypothetical protein